MKTFGKSPRTLFFDQQKEINILGRDLGFMLKINEKSYQPAVGIQQAVRFYENGNIFINTDPKVDFVIR